MTDHPIIFSGSMVRALLEGRKTMTRRLAWRWKEPTPGNRGTRVSRGGGWRPSPWQKAKAGDRLWVREAWCPANSYDGPCVLYRANTDRWYPDYDGPDYGAGPSFDYGKYPCRNGWSHWAPDVEDGAVKGYRPSIHMPRWASRLTLTVTAPRIEKLQAINDQDAIAEGLVEDDGDVPGIWYVPGSCVLPMDQITADSPRKVFASLWRALHGDNAWADNPDVVALGFTVHQHNIDHMPEAA